MSGVRATDLDRDMARALAALPAGRPLGEGQVFGWAAVALLQAGASESDFEPYRSALFLAARKIHGLEVALARERELLDRHNLARQAAGLPRYERVAGRAWQARNPAGEGEEEDVL